ncbi:carboxypeptidase-like regulatory domain-containing protein [bacterium]|nr:carboxypeptidase-like regulatory domain-containing protein [bacterium]
MVKALLNANVFVPGTKIGAGTDLEGSYQIDQLIPGIYKLKFSATGFSSYVIDSVLVSPDSVSTVSVSLEKTAVLIE